MNYFSFIWGYTCVYFVLILNMNDGKSGFPLFVLHFVDIKWILSVTISFEYRCCLKYHSLIHTIHLKPISHSRTSLGVILWHIGILINCLMYVIVLLSAFKLQRSRWFRIGLENTFPGFFSQEFFHRFFVSGLTSPELICKRPIVIVTITMYTVSPTGSPCVGCDSRHA